jgi:hypothetical protein
VVALWEVGTRARHFAFGVVALTALYIALWLSFGNVIHKHYETPTPVRISDSHRYVSPVTFSRQYWCWISPEYEGERITEYIFIWMALFASVIMYIPLYLWMKGHLSTDPEKWYKFRLSESDEGYQLRRAALGMLL